MSVSVRKAKIEDLPKLQKLGTELMLSDRRFDPLLVKRWYWSKAGKAYLSKEIKGRNRVCFLAEVDGAVIGYASCQLLEVETWRPVKRAELDNLVVTEQYRSQGAGHQLMTEFKQWAMAKGAVKVKVNVNALNKDAQRFYEDNGFMPQRHTLEADI